MRSLEMVLVHNPYLLVRTCSGKGGEMIKALQVSMSSLACFSPTLKLPGKWTIGSGWVHFCTCFMGQYTGNW